MTWIKAPPARRRHPARQGPSARGAVMFQDRKAAGAALAARLAGYRGTPATVLALPRGGVPLGAAIAQALGLPLDLLLVRKIGLPGQPELALAAVAGPAGEVLVVNEALARAEGFDAAAIATLAAPARAEIARRRAAWMGDRPPPDLAGRTAIVVDDGVATGATLRAALRALRALRPARVVVAVPVGPAEVVASLAREADEVICLEQPRPFVAVGAHYAAFPQVADAEVAALMSAPG